MRALLSWYSFSMPTYVVYMLQQVDYQPLKLLHWLRRWPLLNQVMQRRNLDKTKAATSLLWFTRGACLTTALIGLALLVWGGSFTVKLLGSLIILGSPFMAVGLLLKLIYLARLFIITPRERRSVAASQQIFAQSSATIVAIAGSYGKTTFKELLSAIVAKEKKLAVTPGNMNTPIAHARFAAKLAGKEQVIIIEYGEERPGDVARFARTTQPDYAVITGLAPNHLDYYHSVDTIAGDLLSLRSAVQADKLLINSQSPLLKPFVTVDDQLFSEDSYGDWAVRNISISLDKTTFLMQRAKQSLQIKSNLLGRHQVVPLVMAVDLALKLGISKKSIERAIAELKPFEHRMQPRTLAGATILDDTYNGNIAGILAGLDFLKEVSAKRKIYVTPGLVDQGSQTEVVHHQIAKKLYDVAPDLIVLMDNSATRIVEDALGKLGYDKNIQVESNPLHFYQNLEHLLAAGDVIMLQNDWTDNYN